MTNLRVINVKKFAINSKNVRNIDVRMFVVMQESLVEIKEASIFVFWHATSSLHADNTSAMISVILDLANLVRFIQGNLYFVPVA